MRIRSLAAALLLAMLLPAGMARAEEPILPFLAGLRAREYYDTALQYLDSLEKRTDLSAEVRETIPYERALILSAQARELRDPVEQAKQLESARTLLTKFIASGSKNPRAGDANSDLGQLLLTRGRMRLLQLRSSGNAAQRSALQKQARDDFTEARPILETALRLYKEKYDAFAKQIDRGNDKSGFEAREMAMANFIKAQFDLGTCTFEEAHTYDASNPEFKVLLGRAAGEFEKIYQQFRTNGAGIHALLFQGKCFQEQGEFNKALGIFDQILKLQEETGRLRPLQDQAKHLRLVCLGDDKRPDLKGVKAEAEEWLKTAPPASKRSRAGLGIQWELAQALDRLAKDKEISAAEKDLFLKQALATVQYIHQYPGELKEPSGVMLTRLNSALKIKGSSAAPKDFDAAFTAAAALASEIEKRSKALNDATPEDKPNLEKSLALHLRATAQAYKLAMGLYTVRDSLEDLNKSRMTLSKIYYALEDHSYEAALLAEHIATRYKSVDEKQAQEAAYLSMAAYMQGYLAAPESQKKVNLDRLLVMGNYLVEQWPNTEQSNEALMMLGRMYSQIQEPAKAAEFYNRVPEAAPTYLDAQLAAGLAYWQGYAALAVLPEKERPPKAELEGMMKKAQQILKQAVQKAEAKLAKGKPSSDGLNAAKLSLIQILNQSGGYKEAITLLTDGDRALTKEVAVENPKARPEHGTKSQLFASLTYREMLRSYVGTQDVEKARAALKQLETLETGGAAGLNSLLRDLGQQLQGEVQRLQQSNDPRLGEVMTSFEKFLADLLARKDGQDYTMLLWIAETYVALGDGVKGGDQAKANELFKQAAAGNQAILTLAASKPEAVPAAALPAIRLRLIACQRKEQSFDAALVEVRKILKEKPQMLEAQIEAARIYTDWGLRGGTKDGEKWLLAVMGDKASKLPAAEKQIWGWQDLSNRLLRFLKARSTPEIKKMFLDARYNVIQGKYHYALEQPKADTKQSLLQAARLEVLATGILTSLEKTDPDLKRYDSIFRDIQTQLNTISGSKAEVVGVEVALKGDADKPEVSGDPKTEKKGSDEGGNSEDKKAVGKSDEKNSDKEPSEQAPKKKAAKKKAKAKSSGGSSTTIIVTLLVVLAAAGGGGFYFWKLKQQPAKRPARRRGSASDSEEEPAEKKLTPRKRRPLPASPPDEIE